MLKFLARASNILFVMKPDVPFTKLGKDDPSRFKSGGVQRTRANGLDGTQSAAVPAVRSRAQRCRVSTAQRNLAHVRRELTNTWGTGVTLRK